MRPVQVVGGNLEEIVCLNVKKSGSGPCLVEAHRERKAHVAAKIEQLLASLGIGRHEIHEHFNELARKVAQDLEQFAAETNAQRGHAISAKQMSTEKNAPGLKQLQAI
jgi:hypothetical protein